MPVAHLLALLVALVSGANTICAQGTVDFRTRLLGESAKILEAPGFPGAGTPLGNTATGTESGTHYLAQLFAAAGVVRDSSALTPVGSPVNFRGGTSNSGYVQESGTTSLAAVVDPIVTIPAQILLIPGGAVSIQLRAWWAGPNGNTYSSWSQASNPSDPLVRFGGTAIIHLPSTGNPVAQPATPPVLLTNLTGIWLGHAGTLTAHVQTHPLSQIKAMSGSVTFTTDAIGDPPIHYQWRKDLIPIPGATNPSHTRTDLTMADAGSYDVVVTNPYGGDVSDEAILTVVQPGVSSLNLLTNPPNALPGVYAGVAIAGLPDSTYALQCATNLAPSMAWATLTNITLSQPMETWVDTNVDVHAPGNPTRYYRVIAP